MLWQKAQEALPVAVSGVVTARTLAQQLAIPLFAISTLAAFAWSKQAQLKPNACIAVEMPANRGLVYGGIYQNRSGEVEHFTYRSDDIMTPEVWKAILEELPHPWEQLSVSSHLGYTVNHLLQMANLQYQQGKRPHWQNALPFYGKQTY